MVGIPGKSQGCHTCRRRKVKCDLQQPNCLRCIRSGKVCEGYVRGAVFVNRTARGLEKRKPLEEARSRDGGPENLGEQILAARVGSVDSGSDCAPSPSHASDSLMPPQIEGTAVRVDRIKCLFYEDYFPSDARVVSGPQGLWLMEAVRINQPGKALESSLRAVSVSNVGRMKDDQNLVMQGRIMYGIALRELQRAICIDELTGKDETLAACLVLALYEMFESTQGTIQGYQGHVAGLVHLLERWRVNDPDTRFAQVLTDAVRHSAMILSLQNRSTTKYTDPYTYATRAAKQASIEQSLYTHGFSIAHFVETLDSLTKTDRAAMGKQYPRIVQQCKLIAAELSSWYEECLAAPTSKRAWRQFLGSVDSLGYFSDVASDALMPLSFPDLRLAHIMLDFWGLRLLFSTIVAGICAHAGQLTLQAGFVPPDHSPEYRETLAKNIMRSVPYAMGPDVGVSSAQRCIFSLRIALFTFRILKHDSLGRCEDLIVILTVRKGLSFARDISRVSGGWGDTKEDNREY